MDHLFNSVVKVQRLQMSNAGGRVMMTWQDATDPDEQVQALLSYLPCRLDLNFVRPGKDQPPAVNAGRAPDRIGVMFTYPYAPIKAGDRVVAIPNAMGDIPVEGTFEIRVIPDKAIDYSSAHHIEVQVLETNQNLANVFPDGDPDA